MYEILLFIHVVVSLLLILVVLLQSGKGAGLALFGGGGDNLFSAPSGSSFMRQFTTGLAIVFACTALLLTLFVSRTQMRSVTSKVPPPPPKAEAQSPGQAQTGGFQPVRPGQGVEKKNQPPAGPIQQDPGSEKIPPAVPAPQK